MSQPNHHLPNGHSSLSHHATTSNNAASSSLHQNGQSSRHLIARHSSAARDGDSHRPKAPARADIHTIKQELHDELGENGLAYWKALHGYLMGQVGRNEMESLVRTWLKGKVSLHNKLLLTLLCNAATPPASHPSASQRKRKRVGPDDVEYDTDETFVEPKMRIQHWMMGIGRKERARMRRAVLGRQQQAAQTPAPEDAVASAADDLYKKLPMPLANSLPPLAISSRLLPSATQLSQRLSQVAKNHDLTLSTDTASTDIGDFLAVGVDAHVSDILHSLVHLIGHDRPGSNTVKIPAGVHRSDQGSDEEDSDQAIKLDELGDIPKPDLESLRNLFILNPSLHTSTSPAVYKLASGVMLAETEFNEAPSPSSITAEAKSTGSLHNDVKPSARSIGPGMNFEQLERRKQQLVDLELLDLDDAKKVGDEVGKKAKTHKNHWKYEDPALILKSVLG